ncbi:ATP-binding cassette domain-containing protein [bacterium]|nr:ATP-binding cassette domain-containing protein [bacterium]MBR4567961.1 ATP-binding cassette domain-containing protein [bacterium]
MGQIKPEKRTIYYKMEDMAEFGDDEIQRYRRKIGIIFQDYQLINSLTAKQNVIYPLVLDQIPLTEIKKKYEAINTLLDISSIETTEIKKLS